jgi:hypothetical protein
LENEGGEVGLKTLIGIIPPETDARLFREREL